MKFNDLDLQNWKDFANQFKIVCENSLKHLEKNRYFAIVIWKYRALSDYIFVFKKEF